MLAEAERRGVHAAIGASPSIMANVHPGMQAEDQRQAEILESLRR